jgi:hypothetical protein
VQHGLAEWPVCTAPLDVPPSHIYLIIFVHTGIGSGGAVEYVRSANSSPETLRSRRIRAALDVIPILALFVPTCHYFLIHYMSAF